MRAVGRAPACLVAVDGAHAPVGHAHNPRCHRAARRALAAAPHVIWRHHRLHACQELWWTDQAEPSWPLKCPNASELTPIVSGHPRHTGRCSLFNSWTLLPANS